MANEIDSAIYSLEIEQRRYGTAIIAIVSDHELALKIRCALTNLLKLEADTLMHTDNTWAIVLTKKAVKQQVRDARLLAQGLAYGR